MSAEFAILSKADTQIKLKCNCACNTIVGSFTIFLGTWRSILKVLWVTSIIVKLNCGGLGSGNVKETWIVFFCYNSIYVSVLVNRPHWCRCLRLRFKPIFYLIRSPHGTILFVLQLLYNGCSLCPFHECLSRPLLHII